MITVRGLEKSYGSVRVLDRVDLDADAGTVVALLGPNGAGKTTMVQILSTLVRPDGGSAAVAGHDVVQDPVAVRRSISLTGQYAAVDDLLTGEEHLLLVGRLRRLGRADRRRRARELLEQFDLVEAARRQTKTYSGGMRRRLDVAISLITRPPVVFLDEPTTGLDPRSRQTMWEIIRQLVADGTTILLTTQYLEEADQLADRVVLLDKGRVVTEGPPAELKRRVAVERVDLTFASPADLDRAARAVGSVGGSAQSDPQRLLLGVPTDGTAGELRVLLDRLDREGIPVERVALSQPSLDEVFLTLTSR